MKLYREIPSKLSKRLQPEYILKLCFDEILERQPIIYKDILRIEDVSNYVQTYQLIHQIIYECDANKEIVESLRNVLQNKKCKTTNLKKSFNFLDHNISKSLSHIYQATRKYDTIFKLFDLVHILKIRKYVLRIYPLIEKLKDSQFHVEPIEMYEITPQYKINYINSVNFQYDKIIQNISRLQNKSDKLIYGIYHLFPVRLAKEYDIMLVKMNNENIANGMHYYDYANKEFVFNVTKYSLNKNPYQVRRFKLLSILHIIIDEFIEENQIGHNQKLIPFKTDHKLQKVSAKVYGYHLNSLQMKRIYTWSVFIGRSKYMSMNTLIRILFIINTNSTEAQKFIYQDIAPLISFDNKNYTIILKPLLDYLIQQEKEGNVITNEYYSSDYIKN
jgi:hypothetical protein